MEKTNPIDIFFSAGNINLLYDQIKTYMLANHQTDIGREYLGELIEIMKLVIKPIKRIPKNTDVKQFIITLNQKTLAEAIPIFSKVYSKSHNNNHNQQQQQRVPTAQITSLPGSIPQPSSTLLSKEHDLEEKFNELRSQNTNTQTPKHIDFTKLNPAVNDPKCNIPVDQLFQQYANHRQNEAKILPPPKPKQQLQQQPHQQPHQQQHIETFDSPTYKEPPFHPNYQFDQQFQQEPKFQEPTFDYHLPNHQQLPIHQHQKQQPNQQPNQQQISVDSIYEEHSTVLQNTKKQQKHKNDFTNVSMSMNQYNIEPPQPDQLQTLIPKVSRNTVHESRIIPVIVTVDSRDKDPSSENDNSYRISIDEIKDVVSIELTDAQIPISEYVINSSNNLIYFEETNGITLIAELTIGNYDPDDLATEIETQMTAVGNSTYTVGIDPVQNRFVFNSDGAGGAGIFNLLFDGGTVPIGFEREKTVYIKRSVGEVIGFAPADLTGALEYTGQYTYNLKGEKYLLLHVKEAELLKTRDSNVKNAFAKIVLDKPLGETKFYSSNTDNKFIKYFSPPIGRLGYLTIEFRKQNGDLYDFNGQYNSLTFEIITKDITKSPY